jgi:NTE family protein
VSMEVPAAPLLQMGADRVISVVIPNQEGDGDYGNMFSVVSRCFQLMSARTENSWRRYSNIVISPPVADMSWDSFASANRLIELGEQSAMASMPQIKRWLAQPAPAAAREQKASALPSAIQST